LAHVRDIEQAGGGAAMQMLGEDASLILHRHGVTGERHHAATEFTVQSIEWGGFQNI
jgi:hypothetical protein